MPELLNKLNRVLGDDYRKATQSYLKSISGNEIPQNVANLLRSFIQSFWGELVDMSRKTCNNNPKYEKRFELKKVTDRALVANCLAKEDANILLLHLGNLYQTYETMSKPAKDISFNDQDQLQNLFKSWVFQIEAILASIIQT